MASMPIAVSQRSLRRSLWCATALVSLLGLLVELLHYLRPSFRGVVIPLFSLSIEGNFPTWYASGLLLCCGLWLLAITVGVRQRGEPYGFRWGLLACGFLFMSLDEAIELHENLGQLLDLHGVLFFSWVVPAGLLVLGLAILYLPFLKHLPSDSRLRFVLAGGLYLTGALVLELPLGHWAERHGHDNLTYVLIDWVEETLELVGATYFLLSLTRYIGAQLGELRIVSEEPQPPASPKAQTTGGAA
jgi:hypothetical protein